MKKRYVAVLSSSFFLFSLVFSGLAIADPAKGQDRALSPQPPQAAPKVARKAPRWGKKAKRKGDPHATLEDKVEEGRKVVDRIKRRNRRRGHGAPMENGGHLRAMAPPVFQDYDAFMGLNLVDFQGLTIIEEGKGRKSDKKPLTAFQDEQAVENFKSLIARLQELEQLMLQYCSGQGFSATPHFVRGLRTYVQLLRKNIQSPNKEIRAFELRTMGLFLKQAVDAIVSHPNWQNQAAGFQAQIELRDKIIPEVEALLQISFDKPMEEYLLSVLDGTIKDKRFRPLKQGIHTIMGSFNKAIKSPGEQACLIPPTPGLQEKLATKQAVVNGQKPGQPANRGELQGISNPTSTNHTAFPQQSNGVPQNFLNRNNSGLLPQP